MTDMATGLGGTASCPRCGAQVQVTEVDAAVVRCPDCGQAVPTGVRGAVADDLTAEELERAFGVNGYDAEVRLAGDGALSCSNCATATDARQWAVDDLRRGSDPATVEGEAVVAAVRCPSCGAPGVLLVSGPGNEEDARVVRALERAA